MILDSTLMELDCWNINSIYHSFIDALCGDEGIVVGLIHLFVATMLCAIFLFVNMCTMPNKSSLDGDAAAAQGHKVRDTPFRR